MVRPRGIGEDGNGVGVVGPHSPTQARLIFLHFLLCCLLFFFFVGDHVGDKLVVGRGWGGWGQVGCFMGSPDLGKEKKMLQVWSLDQLGIFTGHFVNLYNLIKILDNFLSIYYVLFN